MFIVQWYDIFLLFEGVVYVPVGDDIVGAFPERFKADLRPRHIAGPGLCPSGMSGLRFLPIFVHVLRHFERIFVATFFSIVAEIDSISLFVASCQELFVAGYQMCNNNQCISIITSRVSARGNIFGSVCVCVCVRLSVCALQAEPLILRT